MLDSTRISAARFLMLVLLVASASASFAGESLRRSAAVVATNSFPPVGYYRGTLTNGLESASISIVMQSNGLPTAMLAVTKTVFVDWGLPNTYGFFSFGEVALYRRGHVVVKFGDRGFFRGQLSADGQSVEGLFHVRPAGIEFGYGSGPISPFVGGVLRGVSRRMNLTYEPLPPWHFLLFPGDQIPVNL